MPASSANRSADSALTEGRVGGHGGEHVVAGHHGVAVRRAPGRRPAGRRVGRRGRSRPGVNPEVRAATSAGSPDGRNSAASSAPLHLVGSPDRDDQVEPAGTQQRRVDGGDRVGGHHDQSVRAGLELGHGLQQLVDQGLAVGSLGPVRGDLVGLVDEGHQAVDPAEVGQRVAQGAGPLDALAEQRRVQFHERPATGARRWPGRTTSCPSPAVRTAGRRRAGAARAGRPARRGRVGPPPVGRGAPWPTRTPSSTPTARPGGPCPPKRSTMASSSGTIEASRAYRCSPSRWVNPWLTKASSPTWPAWTTARRRDDPGG